jgi:hypothetical protein
MTWMLLCAWVGLVKNNAADQRKWLASVALGHHANAGRHIGKNRRENPKIKGGIDERVVDKPSIAGRRGRVQPQAAHQARAK